MVEPMPDRTELGPGEAPVLEPNGCASGAAELAVDEVGDASPAYDLAEIGVDEMEPPSPTAEAALDPPTIAPPAVMQGGLHDAAPGAYSAESRTSPPPDGVFPARETAPGANGRALPASGAPQPETRARAEEVNSGSKIVPKIDEAVPEFLGLYLEMESWFSTFDGDAAAWLMQTRDDGDGVMDTLRRCLNPRPASTYRATSQLLSDVLAGTLSVLDDKSTLGRVVERLPTTEICELTLIYVLLAAHCAESRPPLLAEGVPLVTALMSQVASLRWSIGIQESPEESSRLLSRLFMLCRVALLATFGGSQAYKDTSKDVWEQYGLEPLSEGGESAYTSPLSYASFLQSITKRYPTFVPAEDHAGARANQRRLDLQAPWPPDPRDPRELVHAGANVLPYVPQSIVEACELFKSRIRASPQVLQLWEEQERAQHIDVPGSPPVANSTTDAVRDLYKSVMRIQKSFIQVVVEFGMQAGGDPPGPGIHAALATTWMLLQWYDLTHVLMGEYVKALLFDCQFHLMAHSFCGTHTSVLKTLLEPYDTNTFWAGLAGATAIDDSAPPEPSRGTELLIEDFNKYNLKTYTYVVGIVRQMIVNNVQRTIVVAELPVDPLKALFGVYEQELWTQLLQLLKLQVPFHGKRWRYLNMEIISAIYLYCPSKLDDDWLSGADVARDIDVAAQECMLRDLIERFNGRLN